MKMTPRSQGCKWRKASWPEGKFYKIRRVGRDIVEGYDQDGKYISFVRSERDADWIEVKEKQNENSR